MRQRSLRSGVKSMRCAKKNNRGWQCSKQAVAPFKTCADCRKIASKAMKKWRGLKTKCVLCRRPSKKRRVCFRCTAKKAEQRHPDMAHDTHEHVRMLQGRHKKNARCQASGISLLTLEKMGEVLTVDRINPFKGYVRGNMQLLARYLNSAKGVQRKVPKAAVKRLRRKMVRYSHDKLSAARV